MIAVTMGDANGVGPEILVRSIAQGLLPESTAVYGDGAVLAYAVSRLGLDRDLLDRIRLVDLGLLSEADLTPGIVSDRAGEASVAYVERATRDALAGNASALVTLPINKEACRASHPDFSGHTEFIASLCGDPPVTMMLASDRLIVTHVSTHVPLAEAIVRARTARIVEVIRLTHEAVRRLRDRARIAVAGLNPHAGEHGAFGAEDDEQIRPAIEQARREGIDAYGPEPGDTVFYNAAHRDRFDAVVCMYHDQGHIPMKTLDFDGGVNVTLGLPIVRTSVDHGTAYDIAYQGMARTRSFELAIEMARRLSIGVPGSRADDQ
jgi:4-phospho-D-threonate 3-dehydrogenase / 4-phospho-D-erythronate 3-dehydrogenase